jgi:hypothetical protein
MIRLSLAVLAAAFALKILWNLGVPYWLAVKAYRSVDGMPGGVSLMAMFEVVLLLCMTGIAAGLDEGGLVTPKWVALIGGAMVIGSYVHLFLVGSFLSWAVVRSRRRRPVASDSRSGP